MNKNDNDNNNTNNYNNKPHQSQDHRVGMQHSVATIHPLPAEPAELKSTRPPFRA